MRAVIYAAKSTEDKHGSIPTQLDDCREMAEREGWEVVGEFRDEAFSAYHGNRGPGLAAAKQRAIDNAPCVLVAQDADRFARGAGDAPGAADHLGEVYFAMKRQRVELWTVRSRQLDLLRAALEGERANDETARKAQAVKRAITRERAKGKPWGEPPQGYRVEHKVIDGEPVTGRAVDPEAMPIIEALFAELDTGATTGEVARKLNRAGYRTKRGQAFTARRVRAMAENADYKGTGPHPLIIDPELWDRVNEKIRRDDPASLSHGRGGRESPGDFMLRRLAFCHCGQPCYSLTRHDVRIYVCKSVARYTGTCDAKAIPADLVEGHVLNHLELFLGEDLETWIGERMAERSGERTALEKAVDEEKTRRSGLERQRAKLMAEYERLALADDPLARYALEPVARLDADIEAEGQRIGDAEAQLAEWTAKINADGVLDWYTRIRDLVRGRIAKAEGIAEINAALHDSLMGVWLAYDGETLTADIKVRPSGLPEYDLLVAELFGSMPSREESLDLLATILPDESLLAAPEGMCL